MVPLVAWTYHRPRALGRARRMEAPHRADRPSKIRWRMVVARVDLGPKPSSAEASHRRPARPVGLATGSQRRSSIFSKSSARYGAFATSSAPNAVSERRHQPQRGFAAATLRTCSTGATNSRPMPTRDTVQAVRHHTRYTIIPGPRSRVGPEETGLSFTRLAPEAAARVGTANRGMRCARYEAQRR